MNTQRIVKRTVADGSVSFGKKSFRIPFLIGIWLFVACLLIQLFTVGMSVFINPSWWTNHVLFSHVIGALGLILFLVALFGRFPKEIWGLTGLMNILFFVQGITANLSSILPALSLSAAFHPVNAFLLFWTATAIAWKTSRIVMSSSDAC
jgi:Family of unknown function (DUF6220)